MKWLGLIWWALMIWSIVNEIRIRTEKKKVVNIPTFFPALLCFVIAGGIWFSPMFWFGAEKSLSGIWFLLFEALAGGCAIVLQFFQFKKLRALALYERRGQYITDKLKISKDSFNKKIEFSSPMLWLPANKEEYNGFLIAAGKEGEMGVITLLMSSLEEIREVYDENARKLMFSFKKRTSEYLVTNREEDRAIKDNKGNQIATIEGKMSYDRRSITLSAFTVHLPMTWLEALTKDYVIRLYGNGEDITLTIPLVYVKSFLGALKNEPDSRKLNWV